MWYGEEQRGLKGNPRGMKGCGSSKRMLGHQEPYWHKIVRKATIAGSHQTSSCIVHRVLGKDQRRKEKYGS